MYDNKEEPDREMLSIMKLKIIKKTKEEMNTSGVLVGVGVNRSINSSSVIASR